MTATQVLQRETEQSTLVLYSGWESGNKVSLVKCTSLSGEMFKVAAKNDVYLYISEERREYSRPSSRAKKWR